MLITRLPKSSLLIAGTLLLGGLLAGSVPAQAATTLSLTASQASGSDDSADSSNASYSLPGCSGALTYAYLFLVKKAEPLPVSMDDATTLIDSVQTPETSIPALYSYPQSIPDSTGSGTVSNFVAGGAGTWEDALGNSYKTLNDVAGSSTYGAGTYTLTALCFKIDTSQTPVAFLPVPDPSDSTEALAAVLGITINADKSWSTGAVTLPADVTGTTVGATATKGGGAALTATVKDTTTSSKVPAGTVQFFDKGAKTPLNSTGAPVDTTSGVASFTASASQLPAGAHSITATFTPSDSTQFASSTSAALSVTVPAADGDGGNGNGDGGDGGDGDATPLSDGGTVTPGSSYAVSIPAGTFGDGDTVDITVHSDPIELDPATAADDGSLDYTFTVPADLPAGSHSLVFTDASDSTKTATVAFTVAAADDPGNDDPTNNDPGASSVDPGTNPPSSFLTDSTRWATQTPQGLAAMVGALVLVLGAGLGGWTWFWRRRAASQRAGA